jgi:hypothetical protein
MDALAQHVQDRNTPTVTTYLAGRPSKGTASWLEKPKQGNDLAELKSQIDFRSLVAETHTVKADKVLCPAHDDHTPSCHIYDDHWHCFSCCASGDVITWVERVQGITTADAIRILRERVGGTYLARPSRPQVSATPKQPTGAVYTVVEAGMLEIHGQRAARLNKGPKALSGRGFTVADLRRLNIAADGEDAILPITGPTGAVLALKRRYAVPRGKMRYVYDTPGHGTPAWCSPGFLEAAKALVIEGELNGMASWLACPDLGVMGAAGTSGSIYADALQDKTVFVYADGDDVGRAARDRWAEDAIKAGAARVYVLEPWEMDACDIAGKLGRTELAGRLA